MSLQAERDAKHKCPIIAHKNNGGQWLAILRLDDLLTLLQHADLISHAKHYAQA